MDGELMIGDIIEIEQLMEELSEAVDGHTNIYLIGGGAMMFLGMKGYTKDLDLVVSSEDEYSKLIDGLSDIGFISDKPTEGLEKTNLSDTQVRGDYRVDIFSKEICGKLQLSDTMMNRSIKRYTSEKLDLYSCSVEDIFLLKSVTERRGDLEDCNNLIRISESFDWASLTKEIREQVSSGGSIWITYLTERMERLGLDSRRPDVYREISAIERECLEKWADVFEGTH